MGKFTFHIVSLPHTQTTKEYNQCAYTQKVRKFCNMMKSLGHTVNLYASEDNEAACDELITCITKKEQEKFLGKEEWFQTKQFYKVPYDETLPFWDLFNTRVIAEIKKRVKKNDIVCIITGQTQQKIYRAFPFFTVEFGIGYSGVIAKYKVFESYAWMHYVYGKLNYTTDRIWETVIPNSFEINDFPYEGEKKDYLLFMSRPIKQKGIDIAINIAKKTGKKLIIAGAEEVKGENIEWVGYADTKKRGELMSKARALLCPTMYVGPFEGVVVEAQLCGTPVITTAWGCFVENVKQGVSGFRCHTLEEFVQAVEDVSKLNSWDIRVFASQYSVHTVADLYQKYFERISKPIEQTWRLM